MADARTVLIRLGVILSMCGVAPTEAWAQSAKADEPSAAPRWLVTFRVGGASSGTPSKGTSSIPPAALPFNFLPGTFTRQVASWYFGDGPVVFNTNAFSGQTITSIDPVVGGAATARSVGAAFGVSASTFLSSRFRLSFSLDGAHTAPTLSDASRATIESSRSSFSNAFGALFSALPTSGASVSSDSSVTPGGGFEWTATVGVEVVLRARGRTTWYATAGEGLVGDTGTLPSFSLTGHYAFTISGARYDQTDAITVHAAQTSRRWTTTVGGGWRHDLNRRWALDAGLQLGFSQSGMATTVDAAPTSVSTPNANLVLGIGKNPILVFSNYPASMGNLATLANSLNGIRTFVTTGPQLHVLVNGGLVMRF